MCKKDMPEATREAALRLAFNKAGIRATWKVGHGARVSLNKDYDLSVIFADWAFNIEGRRDLVAETGLMNKKAACLWMGLWDMTM